MTTTVVSQAALQSINATEAARCLALACLALYVYDYCITLSDEVTYFWSGSWSLSRILFLTNRYLSALVLAMGVVCLLGVDFSPKFCARAVPATFVMDYIAIAIVQGIIVVRIWYIFIGIRVAQLFVIASFLSCFASSAIGLGLIFSQLGGTEATVPVAGTQFSTFGCMLTPFGGMWKMLLPNLILHTILYMATTWPAVRVHRRGASSPLITRLTRDGGVFYVSIFAASMFSTIGTLQHQRLSILIPALYSNSLLAISSVSISHLMLNIRSLASALSLDSSDLLLSATELSRVRWRAGARAGEIIVDVNAVEEDHELQALAVSQSLHMTQVGVYDDALLPGADRIPKQPHLHTRRMVSQVLQSK